MTMIERAKPLDSGMDNVDAWAIGELASLNQDIQAGDYIDSGLSLARLLAESGYLIVKGEPRAPFPPLPTKQQLRDARAARRRAEQTSPPSALSFKEPHSE